MRVLFTCHPGHGHFFPLIPLARAYQRAGHDVLLATGPNICPVVERLGMDTVPIGLSAEEIMVRYRAAAPETATMSPEDASIASSAPASRHAPSLSRLVSTAMTRACAHFDIIT